MRMTPDDIYRVIDHGIQLNRTKDAREREKYADRHHLSKRRTDEYMRLAKRYACDTDLITRIIALDCGYKVLLTLLTEQNHEHLARAVEALEDAVKDGITRSIRNCRAVVRDQGSVVTQQTLIDDVATLSREERFLALCSEMYRMFV